MSRARPAIRYHCFAIAAPGLEPVVAAELTARATTWAAASAAAVTAVRVAAGGVEFEADAAGLARVQLWSRSASRVIVRLATFKAVAFHELERAARKVEWARMLPPDGRFTLRVTCRKSRLYHSDAVAERVAAAIRRAVPGATPAVGAADDEDDDAPDAQRFLVRFDRDLCTVSADASGALLHRRGYRLEVARAPLRETLAAAMLLAAEWDPVTPLADPMCGSGTIPIEAAMLARNIAPGLARPFAAERWPETPPGTYADARAEARAAMRAGAPAAILAADRDEGAVAAARANAERAGVAGDIVFRVAALSALEVPAAATGLVIANPPYGIRVGETKPLRDLFARLGQVARDRLVGWRVALLSADATLDAQARLPFEPRFTTSNGGIPVRFAVATVTREAAAAREPRPPRGPRPARRRR